jgi:hypothetical protein
MYIYVTYLSIDWPSQFTSFFKWTGIANLAILDIAPVDCIRPGNRVDFYAKHSFNVAIIPVVFAGMVVLYFVGVVFLKLYYTKVCTLCIIVVLPLVLYKGMYTT